jgi:hypothetical protein
MKDTSHISEAIARHTEEFLAKGGKIKVIPPQTFSTGYTDNVRRDFTVKNNRGEDRFG